MGIDEKTLTKGQVRKLDALAEEVFGKWLAQQASPAAERKPDPIAVKIEEALAAFVDDRTFRLGNYGYTIKRARGERVSGFVVTKTSSQLIDTGV